MQWKSDGKLEEKFCSFLFLRFQLAARSNFPVENGLDTKTDSFVRQTVVVFLKGFSRVLLKQNIDISSSKEN